MEVNGIAHIQLTVANVKESKKFYEPFLHFLEMMTLIDTGEYFYCIGSRTGIAISQLDPVGCQKSAEAKLQGDRTLRAWHSRRYRHTSDTVPDRRMASRALLLIEVNHVSGKGHLAKRDAA